MSDITNYKSEAIKACCPHCGLNILVNTDTVIVGKDFTGSYYSAHVIGSYRCPSCEKLVIVYFEPIVLSGMTFQLSHYTYRIIEPQSAYMREVPKEVPEHIAEDYREAFLIKNISPKASAALSRRCMQIVLREAGNTQSYNLNDQIEEIIVNGNIPSDLISSIDAIRQVGNFAAHPVKSKGSGEIVSVEPHEAEWNLHVLVELFDYYYVRPNRIKEFESTFNTKLENAGKQKLREPK